MQKTIMISRPNMGASDATRYTYKWADRVIGRARYLGYEVYDYKKNSVNYENITNGLINHNPDVYMHFGHGCPDSLIGQESCIVMNDMEHISNDKAYGEDINCMPLCIHPSNVNLLKDKVVISIACHSAKKLGKYSMDCGARAFIGFNDYLIFIADGKGSEKLFNKPILEFVDSLLSGDELIVAKEKANKIYDDSIRKYKKYRFLALLLLWDMREFTVYGDDDLTLFN